jgi:ketosteroid isomerase-like protein
LQKKGQTVVCEKRWHQSSLIIRASRESFNLLIEVEVIMRYRNLVPSSCLIGAGLLLCGPVNAADDAVAICNAAINAYGAGIASGDAAKLAAVYAPDGELVSPWGAVAGHDALVKNFASYMKPGDKDVDTLASSRMIGDVVLCTGGYTFTPASGASAEKGFWTKVVGKAGGEWKILNLTFAIAAPQ